MPAGNFCFVMINVQNEARAPYPRARLSTVRLYDFLIPYKK